jgi:serine/threonine-protein kinase RsbW
MTMPSPVFADDGRFPRPGSQQQERRRDRSPPPSRWLVEVEVDTERPRLELRASADKDGLPLARQALRALGHSVGADFDALHDAELALTEACSNVVRHAYPEGTGTIHVIIESSGADIRAVVGDRGIGMPQRRSPPRPIGGLGLKVIDAVAGDVEIRSAQGIGTEVAMEFPVSGSPADARDVGEGSVIERVIRRLVAIVAAHADLPPTRITEVLMATEMVARQSPRRVVGRTVRLRIERDRHGIEIYLGPLLPGAAAVVGGADTPALGSIVERFADAVWVVPAATGRASDGEELALRFAA